MDKIRVWKKQPPKPEKILLKLVNQEGDGNGVTVQAVNEDGDRIPGGYILIIDERGVTLSAGVNPGIGLPLSSPHGIVVLNNLTE